MRAVHDDPRRAYYDEIDGEHLAPLWKVLGDLVPPEPRPACRPAHWAFQRVAPFLHRSGSLISAEEAERRVLVLENPALRGASRITQSLYAGYQLILPGELAPPHRHTATAIRLVLQGEGACTSVDGERTPMRPGDFIITPSWTFHDHANPGSSPVVWLDGLDVPMVQLFEAGFSGRLDAGAQSLARPDDDSLARHGANMAPEYAAPSGRNPLFRYPYEQTRAALATLLRHGPLHPCHGVKQRFINPSTGGHVTSTLAAFMQQLPAGFEGLPYRATDGTVYCVVEGCGSSTVGEHRFRWQPHDVFVVPPWASVRHAAGEEAVLFSFSDRAAQQALGLWRQEVPVTNAVTTLDR